jgi:hypothetical protein
MGSAKYWSLCHSVKDDMKDIAEDFGSYNGKYHSKALPRLTAQH